MTVCRTERSPSPCRSWMARARSGSRRAARGHQPMDEGLEKVRDGFHAGLDGCRGCLDDLLGEALLALVGCGLLALGWWGFSVAPYPTASIGAGVLLLAGYGAVAYLRDIRGTRLVGRLGLAAVLTAVVVILMLSYLPYCSCPG